MQRTNNGSGGRNAEPLMGGDGTVYFLDDKRPIILYDGVCKLCNGVVNFVLNWDPAGKLRFAALQSEAGRNLLIRCGRSPDDLSSIVLVEANSFYIKSEAVLRIARNLRRPMPVLAMGGLLFPRCLRDCAYDAVGRNRYRIFGRDDACRRLDAKLVEDRFVE